LLSLAGLSSFLSASEEFEPVFLCGSGAMGALALVPAYRKKHRRVSCLVLFASGVLCLLLRHIRWGDTSLESVATAIGASLIIAAHVLNLRFCKNCGSCQSLSEPRINTVDTLRSE